MRNGDLLLDDDEDDDTDDDDEDKDYDKEEEENNDSGTGEDNHNKDDHNKHNPTKTTTAAKLVFFPFCWGVFQKIFLVLVSISAQFGSLSGVPYMIFFV